jgi:hypothetical protein
VHVPGLLVRAKKYSGNLLYVTCRVPSVRIVVPNREATAPAPTLVAPVVSNGGQPRGGLVVAGAGAALVDCEHAQVKPPESVRTMPRVVVDTLTVAGPATLRR